jgi:hypothetical protein
MINIILTLVAFILVGIFTPFSILFTLIFHPRNLSNYFWKFALALDQLGNVTCQYTLNLVFIKKDGVLCGNEDMTVSYVLGANKERGTLTMAGKGLCAILNKMEKDHVEKAVVNERTKNEKL